MLEEQGVSYRQNLYTPIVTVWAWMSQVLDSDKSLSNAVSRVIAWLAAAGAVVPSGDTGAYSKARKRLPLSVLQPLLTQTAQTLQAQVKPEQGWCGRQVKGLRWHHGDDERYSCQSKALSATQQFNWWGVVFRWQNWWCGFV